MWHYTTTAATRCKTFAKEINKVILSAAVRTLIFPLALDSGQHVLFLHCVEFANPCSFQLAKNPFATIPFENMHVKSPSNYDRAETSNLVKMSFCHPS